MPSLQQVKDKQLRDSNAPAPKNPLRTLVKYVIIFTIAAVVILHYTKPKIATLPEELYTAQTESKFKELFTTPQKKIVWFGADCPVSRHRQAAIDARLKFDKLEGIYLQKAYLQNSLFISCFECLDMFVMEKCNGICIILPESRKIIETSEKKLVDDLQKYKNFR